MHGHGLSNCCLPLKGPEWESNYRTNAKTRAAGCQITDWRMCPPAAGNPSCRKLLADPRPHRNHLRTFEKGELSNGEFIRVRQQPPTEAFPPFTTVASGRQKSRQRTAAEPNHHERASDKSVSIKKAARDQSDSSSTRKAKQPDVLGLLNEHNNCPAKGHFAKSKREGVNGVG